jgi:hypothetical protein
MMGIKEVSEVLLVSFPYLLFVDVQRKFACLFVSISFFLMMMMMVRERS